MHCVAEPLDQLLYISLDIDLSPKAKELKVVILGLCNQTLEAKEHIHSCGVVWIIFQAMDCHLYDVMQSPEPMMTFWCLGPCEQSSVES